MKKYRKPKVTKLGQDDLGKKLGFEEVTVKQGKFAGKIVGAFLAGLLGRNGEPSDQSRSPKS